MAETENPNAHLLEVYAQENVSSVAILASTLTSPYGIRRRKKQLFSTPSIDIAAVYS